MSRFYLYANVLLEVGGLKRLPDEVSRLGLSRPLLVTDPGLSELHRLRKPDFVPAKVRDRCAERRIAHRNTDHQA